MNTFVPKPFHEFVPDEESDAWGYVWKKEEREYTLELVCYCGDKEIGAIVLATDSPKAKERVEELSWVEEQAKMTSPSSSITLNGLKEAIRRKHDIYGEKQ